MRFRQIHLDYHTSPLIDGIGEGFNRKEWQETLQRAAVDSITCFSCCHHGWSFHPTEVGEMHPHLKFNLLREQIDACLEIDVKVPVYLTAGVSQLVALRHPEWREISCDGRWQGWQDSPLKPGFAKLCFNTPYLDYLCRLISETVTLFPEANGIFLDIIFQRQCCCNWCMKSMLELGFDPTSEEDRKAHARRVLMNYYRRTTEAAKINNPDMPIFHNSGHITMGDTEILPYFSHLELESLPTGGWGYDHYPMSAAYSRNLGKEFLGMTGKFHTTWGEFGGFKHPNALRYECAAMIANGSKCSIGDQLHPSSKLDESTYDIIGAAYREVAEKEAWCEGAVSAAKVAILAAAAFQTSGGREQSGDVGASRILLEAHIPFEVVDGEMDFSRFDCLILPDGVRPDEALADKIRAFVAAGGKLVLTGKSGMRADRDEFILNFGAEHSGESPWQPDYILPAETFAPSFIKTPFVMYQRGERVKAKEGISLGKIYDPYFNRTFEHFSSHQHTPYRPEASGFDAGVLGKSVLYFSHPVFSIYRGWGAVAVKEFVVNALRAFLSDRNQLSAGGFPSQGRVTLMRQAKDSRYVLHLLYVNTILRGGVCNLEGGTTSGRANIEVIEELNPTGPVEVALRVPEAVKQVRLVPSGEELQFVREGEMVKFTAPGFACHSMVELSY